MPTPKEDETRKEFISRCIPIVLDEGTAEDGEQAAAICHSIWRKAKEEKSMKDNRVTLKSMDDEQAIVAGYGVVFGGKDLAGETFTPDTDLMPDLVPEKLLLYDHGLDSNVKHILGRAVIKNVDEFGVWVEAQIDRAKKYAEEVLELVKAGVLGWSSGSVGHLVDRENGIIKRWPIVEFSLTPTPAEPRTLSVRRLKALAELYPELDELVPEGEPEAAEAAGLPVNESMGGTAVLQIQSESTHEVKTMDGQEVIQEEAAPEAEVVDLNEIVESLREELRAEIKAEFEVRANEPPAVPATKVAPKNVKINSQFGTGDPDKDADFRRWIVSGEAKVKIHKSIVDYPYTVYHPRPDGGVILETKTYKAALQEGAPTEGGYAVPVRELGRIIAKRDEMALSGPWGCQIFTTDSDTFNIPTEDTSMTAFTKVAEEGAITAAENEPTFTQVQLKPYNYKKLIKISDELDEDENSGLSQFLAEALGRSWAITENAFIQTGAGTTVPQGAFVGGTAALTLDSNSAIGAAEIPELIGKLQRVYRDNAILVMNRLTEAYLVGLFGTSGFSFVQPPVGGMFRGQTSALSAMVGYPTWATEDAATIAASAKTLLFGNFNFYAIVRNRSLRVRRLVELYAGTGQIGILANMRTDAGVLQAEAFQYATHVT